MLLRCLGSLVVPLVVVVLVHAENPEKDVPELIRKAGPSIQKAYVQIEKTIRENEKLSKPLPEPYLARGEIWTAVGNHEEALADYLKATDLLYKGKPTLLDQSRYLERLHKTLQRLRNMPTPYYPEDAAQQYDAGTNYYFRCMFDKALPHLTEAIRLNPADPVYWYYRGLTYKQLGRESEAERDVKIGANLVRKAEERNRYIHQEVGQALERVQGPIRQWLTDKSQELPSRSRS